MRGIAVLRFAHLLKSLLVISAGWHQPWKYIDNVTVLNTSAEFMPCAATTMADNRTAYNYWRISGDDAGVA